MLLLICKAAKAGESSPPSAQQLADKVIANELRTEVGDHSHWLLRLDTKKQKPNEEVDEVIETKDGDLKYPISIDGHELNPQERQKADSDLQKLVQNPDALRKQQQKSDEDMKRSQKMLKTIPDAFLFSYGEKKGELVELLFKPNPKFHPTSHESEVFHAMQGNMWVDSKQLRLAEISGKLMREVKFGGGILGHLDRGGVFNVKQQEVAPGYWELTSLHVQMKGKALFFKTIGVDENYTRSDFKQVSDTLTVAQAAAILRKHINPDQQPTQALLSPHIVSPAR